MNLHLKIIFLICTLSSQVFAEDLFTCELEDSGAVNITYIDVSNGQKLNANVGVEKWSEPFKVLARCEAHRATFYGFFRKDH